MNCPVWNVRTVPVFALLRSPAGGSSAGKSATHTISSPSPTCARCGKSFPGTCDGSSTATPPDSDTSFPSTSLREHPSMRSDRGGRILSPETSASGRREALQPQSFPELVDIDLSTYARVSSKEVKTYRQPLPTSWPFPSALPLPTSGALPRTLGNSFQPAWAKPSRPGFPCRIWGGFQSPLVPREKPGRKLLRSTRPPGPSTCNSPVSQSRS